MKLVEGSMRRPVTVMMITVAAVLFGLVSLSRLPLNLLPEISYPTLTLRTEYEDAAPAEVEKLITEPMEEAISVVPGLRSLRSDSRPGVSEITLEFTWKTDMDYAALDVREKIDLVNLPDDAGMPILLRYDPSLDPILRVGVFGQDNLVSLRYLADRVLKKDLESLEGVASVRVRGGLEEEIHVEVDEGKLAALGIPIDAVSRFLDGQNVNAAGGRLRDRSAEYLVRTVNEFAGLGEVGEAILFEEDGRQVRLRDVATITRGYKDREMVAHVAAKAAVELALYKEGSANTVQVARTIKDRLEQLERELPAGTRTEILFDQSTFIEQSLGEVRSNALIGGLLAVFMIYLFLRERRSTTIIGLVIPVSIMATFFVMQQMDVSLNIMSLGGLALGVGMLVDNAIVVLEAIGRHRDQGKAVWEAVRDGASEVSRAVIASTLTTVAVFLPIIFVEGMAGQIFRDQALTVTSSLMVSLLAALTLIPVLASLGQRRTGDRLATSGSPRSPSPSTESPASASASGSAQDAFGVGGHQGEVPGEEVAEGDVPVAPREDASAGAPAGVGEPDPARRRNIVVRALRAVWRAVAAAVLAVRRSVLFVLRWVLRTLAVLLPGLAIRGVSFLLRWIGRGLGVVLEPVHRGFDRLWRVADGAYPRLLQNALDHRGRTVGLAVGSAALAALLVPTLGVELVPPFSQGEFAFRLELPPGTSLANCERTVERIEADLVGDARIGRLFASVGESPELGDAAIERRENVAQINIAIADPGNRQQEEAVIELVRDRLEREDTVRYTFKRPTYFSFRTPIEVHVYGNDLTVLEGYATELARAMTEIPGLRDVRSDLEAGSPEVQVKFRRDRMAALDLDLEGVSSTLRNKIRGEVATRFKEQDRQIDILVRTARAREIEVGQVENLVVSQVEGVSIPLSTVADIEYGRGPSQITHIGQQRAAVVRANLVGRDLGSATRDLRRLLFTQPPPVTLHAELGGQNEEVATSFRSLALAAFLALFMVYLVMASQFESFLHPLVILFSVPLGGIGVVLALAVTGTAVSVVVLIGVVMLTGIVVNNAIVLIDFINQRRRAGLAKLEAIIDAARARLRPILMTTLTTILALLPMALGLGQGAELRAPMAIAVIGGLALGTFLTLFVIPVLYAAMDRKV